VPGLDLSDSPEQGTCPSRNTRSQKEGFGMLWQINDLIGGGRQHDVTTIFNNHTWHLLRNLFAGKNLAWGMAMVRRLVRIKSFTIKQH